MRSQLAAALAAVPPEYRPTTKLANWLGVNRSICHWVRTAATFDGDDALVLKTLPGVEGLESMLLALNRKLNETSLTESALASVQAYREAIGIAGGSKAKLDRLVADLIATEQASANQGTDLSGRARFFEAAAAVVGAASETLSMSFIAQPDGAGGVMCMAALGHVQVRHQREHMPLVLLRRRSDAAAPSTDRTLQGDRAAGFTPGAVIGRFSTVPLPIVTTQTRERALVQVLDSQADAPNPFTVYIGQQFPLPPLPPEGPAEQVFSAVPRVPTRRLLLDVHMHRSMPIPGMPTAFSQFTGSDAGAGARPERRWFDQVGSTPTPTLLEPGRRTGPGAGLATHEEVTSWLLEEAGLSASDVRTFRLDVEYPLWSVRYVMWFRLPTDAASPGIEAEVD